MALVVKDPPASAEDVRDVSLTPGLGRYPEGTGNPRRYSCLENPMGRRAWWATVHGVTKSQTWLQQLSTSVRGSQKPNSSFPPGINGLAFANSLSAAIVLKILKMDHI